MSQSNAETVRWGYAQWDKGDMDAMLSRISPDFEFVSSGVVPGLAASYRGHQGWRDFWREYREAWESLRIEVNELRAIDNIVVALVTQHGRARQGIDVHREFGNVWAFDEEGLVLRLEAFGDWSGALEAAGLPV